MGSVVCLCGDAMTYLGTVSHKPYGVAAGISYDAPFPSTLATRRYMCGLELPNYPVPAIQYRTKYDYSDLRVNTVIGLMMGDFTHHWLVVYWPRD